MTKLGDEQYWSSCKKCGTVNILNTCSQYSMIHIKEKHCQCGYKIQSDDSEMCLL